MLFYENCFFFFSFIFFTLQDCRLRRCVLISLESEKEISDRLVLVDIDGENLTVSRHCVHVSIDSCTSLDSSTYQRYSEFFFKWNIPPILLKPKRLTKDINKYHTTNIALSRYKVVIEKHNNKQHREQLHH
jgi:hypothetical protein